MSNTNRSMGEDNGLRKGRGEEYDVALTITGRSTDRGGGVHASDSEQWGIKPAKSSLLIPRYNSVIQDSRMTFGHFVQTKFIPEHVEHKTPTGQTHYQAILKHVLRPEAVNRVFNPGRLANLRLKSMPDWPYLDEIRLCNIKSDHVRQLIASAVGRGYSPQTVKHIKNVVFAIISHAQREGCFSGPNPVTQVKLPPMTPKAAHNISIDQTRAMLELMQYPEREIALITIATGMNITEICNLQWKRVNLTESASVVEGELIPPRSLAVRTQWNRSGLGDSRGSRKKVFEMTESLFSMLEDLRCRKGSPNPDDFVLTSETGRPVLASNVRNGRLKPIGRQLGIPWLSWHVLRRAHMGLLSEFRSQLNNQMAQIAPSRLQIDNGFGACPSVSETAAKSDTIGSKLSCRSFRPGHHWR